MSWWTKLKIIKIIMYILLAFVLINCLLFELWPTLYPGWLRAGVGYIGLFVIVLGFIWWIVYLVKKHKNKK